MLFRSARGWAWGHRLVYICGSPLIPLVRFVKILREAKPGRFPRAALPLVLLGLFVDGFGECIGYLAGAGETMRGLSEMEFHRERFLTDGDRQAWEAAAK